VTGKKPSQAEEQEFPGGLTDACPPPPRERWRATDSWNFASFFLGMFLESYVFGMATIATGWVHAPPVLRSLLLSWAPLWLIAGIAVLGPLSDRLGRRSIFFTTLSLYGIGGTGLIFSSNYELILISLAIMLFASNYHLFRVHPACTHDGCFRAATSVVPPGTHNGSTRQQVRAG